MQIIKSAQRDCNPCALLYLHTHQTGSDSVQLGEQTLDKNSILSYTLFSS